MAQAPPPFKQDVAPAPGQDPDCFIVPPEHINPEYKMYKAANEVWNLLSQLPETYGAVDGPLTTTDDDLPDITGEGILDCPISQGSIPPHKGVRFIGPGGIVLHGTFHCEAAADWLKTMGNLQYTDSRVHFVKIPGTGNQVRCYEHPLTRQLCCAAIFDEVYAAKFKPTI